MSVAELMAKIEETVARVGWSVMHIFPGDDGSPGFCYTIGNADRGLPELLLIGGCGDSWHACLNAVTEVLRKRGRAFDDGERVEYGARFPVLVFDARDDVRDHFTLLAGDHLGHEAYRVQQVVVADPQGRFPNEDGCAEPYRSVPVFRRWSQ